MEEQRQRNEMEVREFQHGFQRLFEELDEEQLSTFKTMLHILATQTSHPMACLWEGMTAHALKVRFNICITCGVNHDHGFVPDETQQAPPPMRVLGLEDEELRREPKDPSPIPQGGQIYSDDDQPFDLTFGKQAFDAGLDESQLRLMQQYHLDSVHDEDTGKLLRFACTGIKGTRGPCGVTYPTLADRMLNEPEHCDGCFQRTKHG